MKRLLGVIGVISFLTITPITAYSTEITNECQDQYGYTSQCPIWITFDTPNTFFSYAVSFIDERQYNILVAILLFIFILLLADFVTKYSRQFYLYREGKR
jgi:hypothetical protein